MRIQEKMLWRVNVVEIYARITGDHEVVDLHLCVCEVAEKTQFIVFVFFFIQIPKFVMNQVRKQNVESQWKINRDRAVKKLLKKMAYDREKNSEKVEKIPEVRKKRVMEKENSSTLHLSLTSY